MYLVLAAAIAQNTTINYQSVGREITTVSNLKALESVPYKSEVLVFYDYSLDLQKMLDLYYLLDLQFKIIVNTKEDMALFEGIFPTHLLDYKTIDGALIRAIKLQDEVAMHNLQRNVSDKNSITNRVSYLLEVDSLAASPSSNNQIRQLCMSYKNLMSDYILMSERLSLHTVLSETQTKELFALRQSLRKYTADMKAFTNFFIGQQNKYRAITALSVVRESVSLTLPQQIMSLYLKDYGIPNVFALLASLYDSLTTFYNKYVKVVYICEPDGISINLLPPNYRLITNTVQQSDFLSFDYLACVGNVDVPMKFLLSSSAFNTLIVCDARRIQEPLFKGETLFLNLAPDMHTVSMLGLNTDYTITPSEKSKYILREESLTQNAAHGSRNAKLVGEIVNTLLQRRGEA